MVETSSAAPPPEPAFSGNELSALVGGASQVLIGDPQPIRVAAAAFLAGGHILFEDIPGVGKTLLAKALARLIGGSFGRVQGTPDLLPSDLTGVTVFDDDSRSWNFHPGPLFHNVVLADELNRATPRTQSALLEAMAERQVTVDGVSHVLPDPFLVIATQNPQSGDLGTFPLVAGQRDRFAVSLSLGLPGREAELQVLERSRRRACALDPAADRALAPLDRAAPCVGRRVRASDGDAVRPRPGRRRAPARGIASTHLDTRRLDDACASPEPTRMVVGRDHVAPDDVQAVAVAVLAHRILDATNDDLPTARTWIAEFIRQVPVPPACGS